MAHRSVIASSTSTCACEAERSAMGSSCAYKLSRTTSMLSSFRVFAAALIRGILVWENPAASFSRDKTCFLYIFSCLNAVSQPFEITAPADAMDVTVANSPSEVRGLRKLCLGNLPVLFPSEINSPLLIRKSDGESVATCSCEEYSVGNYTAYVVHALQAEAFYLLHCWYERRSLPVGPAASPVSVHPLLPRLFV